MSDSGNPRLWMDYAGENLRVAEMLLEARLFNPCAQNAQQAVEKAVKAALLGRSLPIRRSHNTLELTRDLQRAGMTAPVTDEECELIDSIYLPSKYPPDAAVPTSILDEAVCVECVDIARKLVDWARGIVGPASP